MVKLVLLDEGVATAPHENRLWWTRTVGLVRRHAEQHWFSENSSLNLVSASAWCEDLPVLAFALATSRHCYAQSVDNGVEGGHTLLVCRTNQSDGIRARGVEPYRL
jgi:hypothetical protein